MTVQVIERIEEVLDGSWEDSALIPEGITETVITNERPGGGGLQWC